MSLTDNLTTILVLLWDLSLGFANLVLPFYKTGALVAAQHGGHWPEFMPPQDGDSRSGCPALNAMANHGILPRDGKNISFRELSRKVHETYNFAPSFCFFVPNFAAGFLHKSYRRDTFDLADLNLRSEKAIEHDASLLREDEHIEPDASKISQPLCRRLLASASGKDSKGQPMLTLEDVAAALSLRRHEALTFDPHFSLAKPHAFFSSANASTLLLIYGGNVAHLESHLIEERIPNGWVPAPRERFGLTITKFNRTANRITKAIDVDVAADKFTAETAKKCAPL
ncbi:Chloroperoxidase [Flagelloscypha sp. PMI_526]|nr:Chloroperoxidase [Flagelloscypha sp. PMI_526]